MAAYYNECDPFAAAWLRNLIVRGLIAPGDVDERSIVDVQPDDLRGYTQCHFFAGIGGWSYAMRLAGWSDARPVWTGSCPCQPFSAAGKQCGANDERHLWPAFFGLIRECRPAVVFGEQVAGAAGLAWLDHVCADLESEGYAVAAADLPACSVGAPHRRQRLFWVADANNAGEGLERGSGGCLGARREEYDAPFRLGRSGAIGGVADTTSARRFGALRDAEGKARDEARVQLPGTVGEDGGLGDAGSEGRRQIGADARRRGEGSAAPGLAERPLHERHDNPWRDIEWLPCADGKARPTQPGLFPLVAGLPKGILRGGDSRASTDADNSPEARVGRLRGYGNSIVPQVAAAFIGAYLDVLSV